MGERVTQAEAARRLGVSRQSVNERIKRGSLALVDGLVDLDEAFALMAPTRGTAGATVPLDAVTSYRKSRELREHYAALDAKLNYERTCGLLVDAAGVSMAVTRSAADLRLALDALPERLAPRLATETDPDGCEALLRDAIDAALADFMESLREVNG